MKKLIVILLVALFGVGTISATPSSAQQGQGQGQPQPSQSTVTVTINDETATNLKNTATAFYNYIHKRCQDGVAPEGYCTTDKTIDQNSQKIENTKKVKNGQISAGDAKKETFEIINGFYKELKDFQAAENQRNDDQKIAKITWATKVIQDLLGHKEIQNGVRDDLRSSAGRGDFYNYQYNDELDNDYPIPTVDKIAELINNGKLDEAEKLIKKAQEDSHKRDEEIGTELRKALEAARTEEAKLLGTNDTTTSNLNGKLGEKGISGSNNDIPAPGNDATPEDWNEYFKKLREEIDNVKNINGKITDKNKTDRSNAHTLLRDLKTLVEEIASKTGKTPDNSSIYNTIIRINEVLGTPAYPGTQKQTDDKSKLNVDITYKALDDLPPADLAKFIDNLNKEIKVAGDNLEAIKNKQERAEADKLQKAQNTAKDIATEMAKEFAALGKDIPIPDFSNMSNTNDVKKALDDYKKALNNAIDDYNNKYLEENPGKRPPLTRHDTTFNPEDPKSTEDEKISKANIKWLAGKKAGRDIKENQVNRLKNQIGEARKDLSAFDEEAKAINNYNKEKGQTTTFTRNDVFNDPTALGTNDAVGTNDNDYKKHTESKENVLTKDINGITDTKELKEIKKEIDSAKDRAKKNTAALNKKTQELKDAAKAAKDAENATNKGEIEKLLGELVAAKKEQAKQLGRLGVPTNNLPTNDEITTANGNDDENGNGSVNKRLNDAIGTSGAKVTVQNKFVNIDPNNPETYSNLQALQEEVEKAKGIATALKNTADDKEKNDKELEGKIKGLEGKLLSAKQAQAEKINLFGITTVAKPTNGNDKEENSELNNALQSVFGATEPNSYTPSNGSHTKGNENVYVNTVVERADKSPEKYIEDLQNELNKVNDTNNNLQSNLDTKKRIEALMSQLDICSKANSTLGGEEKLGLRGWAGDFKKLPHRNDSGEENYYSFLGEINSHEIPHCKDIGLFCISSNCRNKDNTTKYEIPPSRVTPTCPEIVNGKASEDVQPMKEKTAKDKLGLCKRNVTELQRIEKACINPTVKTYYKDTILKEIQNGEFENKTIGDIVKKCCQEMQRAKETENNVKININLDDDDILDNCETKIDEAIAEAKNNQEAKNEAIKKFDEAIANLKTAKQNLGVALDEFNGNDTFCKGKPAENCNTINGNSDIENNNLKEALTAANVEPEQKQDGELQRYALISTNLNAMTAQDIEDKANRIEKEVGHVNNDAEKVRRAKAEKDAAAARLQAEQAKAAAEAAAKLQAEQDARKRYNDAIVKLEEQKKLLAKEINKFNGNNTKNKDNVAKSDVEAILGAGNANATYEVPEFNVEKINDIVTKIEKETDNVGKDKDAIAPLATEKENERNITELTKKLNENLGTICTEYKKSISPDRMMGNYCTSKFNKNQYKTSTTIDFNTIKTFQENLASLCRKTSSFTLNDFNCTASATPEKKTDPTCIKVAKMENGRQIGNETVCKPCKSIYQGTNEFISDILDGELTRKNLNINDYRGSETRNLCKKALFLNGN